VRATQTDSRAPPLLAGGCTATTMSPVGVMRVEVAMMVGGPGRLHVGAGASGAIGQRTQGSGGVRCFTQVGKFCNSLTPYPGGAVKVIGSLTGPRPTELAAQA